MDEGQVFQPSSQSLSLRQQVIALTQNYPCPRCTPGALAPFGHTETMECNSCNRHFVPLRGGRLLFPANRLGWKIAPTFWWDGYRWHWGGTTATAKQLLSIVLVSLLPVVAVVASAQAQAELWHSYMGKIEPALVGSVVGLITMQLIYLLCWDFEFCSRRARPRREPDTIEPKP